VASENCSPGVGRFPANPKQQAVPPGTVFSRKHYDWPVRARWIISWSLALIAPTEPAHAQSSLAGDTFHITRAAGPIVIDGDLSDEGWRNATRVEKWYEVNPGDNTEPAVKNVGYVTYDDRFFYVAFEFEEPNPAAIRAPLGDHDSLDGTGQDLAGLFLDTLNTGRTATIFLANARNVQYDAILDDATGENQSPDYFWDSATKIGERKWTLEIRIPFSSLRYKTADPQTWGILLYRNYPRGFRHQFASARLPRGGNCTICRENRLTGLERLPGGAHLVAAPYLSASEAARPRDGVGGAPLVSGRVKPQGGVDVKYSPNADNAIDFAVNPDFSQVESDTAQISANERFALFFPEKRPFFLEGVDLFQTPIQAVYTRTITSPKWGGRITGKDAGIRYTALVAEDAGGGSAILPGPNGSSLAEQDFGSTVFLARMKRDIGLSFVSVLVTDRENRDGEGHSRVVGPDFQWRLSSANVLTGQLLFSETRTPNRPVQTDEWNGQRVSGRAAQTQWQHSTTHVDWSGLYKDFTSGFRSDAGFVPQVGYRELSGFGAWTFRPKRIISQQRSALDLDYQADQSGAIITRSVQPNVFFQTRLSGYVRLAYIDDQTRAGDRVIGRRQVNYFARFSPSRRVTSIGIDGTFGEDIDFTNARPAHGATISFNATIHPSDHLELALLQNQRSLDVDTAVSRGVRLLTERVARVRGTYTFTPRMFARVIGQYVSTARDPSLFVSRVDRQSGTFSGSALFAYKINWQSVMFVGYGDERETADARRLQPSERQLFVKLSYAFQR